MIKTSQNILILFFTILLLFPGVIMGQQTLQDSVPAKGSNETDVFLHSLPPLDTLITLAIKRAPAILSQNTSIEKQKYVLNQARLSWARNLSISVSANAGSYGNAVLDELNIGYKSSLGVKFSIYDILNRRNEVQIAQQEMIGTEIQKDELIIAIRSTITTLYNTLVYLQRELSIRIRAMQNAQINLKIANARFMEGEMAIGEMSNVSQRAYRAQLDCEKTKMDFRNTLNTLELHIGRKMTELVKKP